MYNIMFGTEYSDQFNVLFNGYILTDEWPMLFLGLCIIQYVCGRHLKQEVCDLGIFDTLLYPHNEHNKLDLPS